MKIPFALTFGILTCISFVCEAQNNPGQTVTTPIPASTPYAIKAQDGNSRIWERTVYELDPTGQPVPKKRQYTEMASGLNHLVNGQWVESSETIQILPNGTAVATNGQHQAYFPGDIYQGQIEVVTSDGKHLVSRPFSLSYFDGTNTVVLAELTNSVGIVAGENQVIYPNAFTGLKADLRYTYTKAGFEQDVILHQQPPTPESLDLNPDTARLQVMTEFFSPPQPTVTSARLAPQAGISLTDQNLDFGATHMVPGRAFLLGTNAANAKARVSKHWLPVQGRQFLLEEVPVNAILEGLAGLPRTAMNSGPNKNFRTASKELVLPPQRLANNNASKSMLIAKDEMPSEGFVLDYQTASGSVTNYTFQADMTYYISGNLNLLGTTTIEGGTVVKYANPGPTLEIAGSVNCKTASYRPALFTSVNDNSVGETIAGSTGTPAIDHSANCYYLYFYNISFVTLHDLRMCYSYCPLTVDTGSLNLSDAQFIHNDYPVYLVNVPQANVFNALMEDVQVVAFEGNSAAINVKHLTLDQCVQLGENDYSSTLAITNSLIVGTASMGDIPYTTNYVARLSTNSNVFQTVGAGHYYLATNSIYRNAGTTSIEAAVLADIKTKTTYPPTVYSNLTLTSTLSPQVQRDTDVPDLGYHYDPLDYLIGGCDLYSNLTVTAGNAIGWFSSVGSIDSAGQGYGISLNKGANLTYSGTVTNPCWMASYHTVQEGYLTPVGYFGALMPSTSGSGAIPQLNATFTKWSVLTADGNNFRDNYANGTATFADCEFYVGGLNPYDMSSTIYTNCLFFRTQNYYFGYLSSYAPYTTYENCTFYNGFLALNRYSGQPASVWIVQNTAFDGTGFSTGDNYNGNTNYTKFDYNAYNTNNNSGLSYPYPYTPPPTNRLETIGAHDKFVGAYNWQTSWFGSFYQPTNSLLVNVGSTTANLLGLYHFTTQTNQVKETNSVVDIGYHYVATDTYGNPLDNNGDGIPDYRQDANGNGLVDNGETNWGLAILTQPVNQTVILTSNATFNVTAAGTPPIQYQWYFNSGLMTSVTNTMLILNNVQSSNSGNYYVIVSNSFGSITSVTANLTVLVPPLIVQQPINLTATQGSNATFNVTVSNLSTLPLSYQWYFNTNNLLASATNAWLMLTNVQFTNAGNYSVIISNVAGSAASANAGLTVNPPSYPAPAGLAAWWPAEGNANDIVGNVNGTLQGAAIFTNGEVGQAFNFNGTNQAVWIPYAVSTDLSRMSSWTIECWILPASYTNASFPTIYAQGEWDVSLGLSYGNGVLESWVNDINQLDGTVPVPLGVWSHVALVCHGTNFTFYLNGLPAGSGNAPVISPDRSSSAIGSVNSIESDSCFNGVIDEVSIYNQALSSNQIAAIYNARGGGKSPLPIVIKTQPANQTMAVGGWETFSVIVSGSSPSYQWYFNSAMMPNATNANLMLNNIQSSNAGIYYVVISNSVNTLISSNASLTVSSLIQPFIVQQPLDQAALQWTNATFQVQALGIAPSYQWEKNGRIVTNSSTVTGANSNIITITGLKPWDGGIYSVTISNSYGKAVSQNAMLRVLTPSTILAWGDGWYGETNVPVGLSDIVQVTGGGDNCFFALDAYGQVYGWGSEDSVFGINVPANLTNVIALASGNGTMLALNRDGTVFDWNYNGALNVPYGISNVVAIAAGLEDMVLKRDGTVFVWGNNSYGETNVPSSLTNVVAIAAGSGFCLALTSSGKVIAWGDNTYGETNIPANATNVVAISSCGFNSYLLKADGTVISMGDNATSVTTVVQIAAGVYHAIALKSNTAVYEWGLTDTNYPTGLTNVAMVTVDEYAAAVLQKEKPSTILNQPTNQAVIQGGSLTFVVSATNVMRLNYQWLFNGTSIIGATNSFLTLNNVQLNNAGNYSVVVGCLAGPVTSSNALLTVLLPPILVQQPTNTTATAGSNAIFTVSISTNSAIPLRYQWQFDWINLPGATNASLVFNNVQTNNVGIYSVSVTNVAGAVASADVSLTVLPPASWFQQYWGASYQTNLNANPYADPDGDGFSNIGEYMAGYNPTNSDNLMLGSWRFNTTNWNGDQGQLPLLSTGLGSALARGIEGNAVDMTGPVNSKILNYRYGESNGNLNVALRSGTVNFWFKPSWSGTNEGGTGPGSYGPLINFGEWTAGATNGVWMIYLDSSGDFIGMDVQDNVGDEVQVPYVAIPGGMSSNQWVQIAVTYTATNTFFYVDGALAGTAGGLNNLVPPQNVLTNGFYIGTDSNGKETSSGVFDLLQTYNYPLTAANIQASFQMAFTLDPNADPDGDGIPNSWENDLGLNPLINDSAQSGNRLNYGYTMADWLNQVSGIKNGSINLDAEGNVLSVSQ